MCDHNCSEKCQETLARVVEFNMPPSQEVLRLEVGELHDDNMDHGEEVAWNSAPEWDDATRKALDPKLILDGREKVLDKFQSRGVYMYIDRADAQTDNEGKIIRTWWVPTASGNEVRSRCVAQELAPGYPREDRFAGTLMVLGTSCAFLYADV